MLELLTSAEKIQVELVNSKTVDGRKVPSTAGKEGKLSLLRASIDLFVNHPDTYHSEESLDVVTEALEVFQSHFESSFYDDSELIQILQVVKEVFKHFDEVKITRHVAWFSKFSKRFVKRALSRIIIKIVKKCREYQSKFKSKMVSTFGEQANLTLGRDF